jgi:hypothetical protein
LIDDQGVTERKEKIDTDEAITLIGTQQRWDIIIKSNGL